MKKSWLTVCYQFYAFTFHTFWESMNVKHCQFVQIQFRDQKRDIADVNIFVRVISENELLELEAWKY